MELLSKNECFDCLKKSLLNNNIVLFPTETVFGVGGLVNDIVASKIYNLKKRPKNKALPVLVNSIDMIKDLCLVNSKVENILHKLLPGPITIVLKTKKKENGLDSLAIRYSSDEFLNKVVSLVNKPLYLTSANLSGEEPYKSAFDASKIFKDQIDCYVEGETKIGVPSTIIDLTSDEIKILRQGLVTLQEILERIG